MFPVLWIPPSDLSNRTRAFSGNEWYASSQHLIEACKDPSTELGAAAFTKDRLYNKDGKTYWQYNDEHPSRHDMFANAMGTQIADIPLDCDLFSLTIKPEVRKVTSMRFCQRIPGRILVFEPVLSM